MLGRPMWDAALLLLVIVGCSANGIHHQFHHPKKPVRSRPITDHVAAEDVLIGSDASRFMNHTQKQCKHVQDVMWMTEVGSSIYQTPLIADLYSDDTKEIITPTFIQYMEVLDGATGDSAQGWPYTHQDLTAHTSPLLVDMNRDGNNEIMLATATGELLFFAENGTALLTTIKVPPLRIAKHWYKIGGDSDPNWDRSYIDSEKEREKKIHTFPDSVKHNWQIALEKQREETLSRLHKRENAHQALDSLVKEHQKLQQHQQQQAQQQVQQQTQQQAQQ
eukprot:Sspe_Gene.82884::Locus_54343_Transcript_1_2_Confidence_0.667_Length_897::g.82884::m.82884